MKAKILPLIITLLMVVLLFGCSQKEGTSPETAEEEAWKEAYIDYLSAITENEIDSPAYFNLIFLNDDDIPELVTATWLSHAVQAKLVTFDGKKAVELGEYGQFGMFNYSEKSGMFDSLYSGSGSEYHTVYSFDGKEVSEICSFNKDEYSVPEGDDYVLVDEYYSNSKEISKDEYEALCAEYIDPLNKATDDEKAAFFFSLTPENIEEIRLLKVN